MNTQAKITELIQDIESHIVAVEKKNTTSVIEGEYELSFSASIIKELQKVQAGEKFSYALIWSMIDSMDYESPVFKKVMRLKTEHPELFEPGRSR